MSSRNGSAHRRALTLAELLCSALALTALAAAGGCSSADPAAGLVGPAAACGNGAVDPGETCDTAIASGGSACPATCDDGDACTADELSGAACTAQCSHSPIVACKSGDGCCPKGCSSDDDDDCAARCGDGIVSGGETCDVAVKSGPGACPTKCTTADACQEPILEGSGCQASCVVKTIGVARNGDGCCPKGLTRAEDSDCPAGYGDMCTASSQCASGMCVPNVMCTKTCTFTGAVGQCGIPGHFCFEQEGGPNICYPIAATGIDNDDRYVGAGVPYAARIHGVNDADAFVADLAVGIYRVTVAPSDLPTNLDLVLDVYDGGAMKVGTINLVGPGGTEIVDYTVGAASRAIFVVRAANGLQGNYTIRLEKTS